MDLLVHDYISEKVADSTTGYNKNNVSNMFGPFYQFPGSCGFVFIFAVLRNQC